jgi:excinuclease ABC subunit A
MIGYSEEQILEAIRESYNGQKILLLSPVVRSRKGHYRELFAQYSKKGIYRPE